MGAHSLAGMALALAALAVAAGARAGPSGAGGDGDETVLGQLAAARSVAAAAGDAIWPGFDLRTIPIAVYESGGEALVIQVREAPADFERLPAEGLTTPVYRGPATEAMNANTSGRLGGEVAAFIQRGSLSNELVPGDISLLFHECGHAFRARAPQGGPERWPVEDATRVADYPGTDAANNAWGRVEGRLLRAALEADDEAARETARDFLAVRARRRAALDAAVVTYEQRLELNEGLAEYFGLKAVLLAPPGLGPGFGADGGFYREFLERLARVNVAGRGAERPRFYPTGAAQALLLDRFAATKWKHDVEGRGAPLEELLAAAVGFDVEEVAGRAERVGAAESFASLLAAEQLASRAALAAQRARLLAILAAPGRKLVLDLSRAGGAGNLTSFDPMNIVAVEPDVKVHGRMLSLEYAGGSASFETPVVQDLRRQWLIAALPDGAEVERGSGLVAEGLALRWDGAAVHEEDGLLLVVPRAPPEEELDAAPAHALLASALDESRRPVPAPPFEATDLAGRSHAQPEASPRETTLVFVSAASWAVPAQRFGRRVLAAMGDKPRESGERRWLLVATQCSADELAAWLGDAPRDHVVHDADRWLAQLFDVTSYPAVVRIAADGSVAGRWSGDNEAASAAAVEGF